MSLGAGSVSSAEVACHHVPVIGRVNYPLFLQAGHSDRRLCAAAAVAAAVRTPCRWEEDEEYGVRGGCSQMEHTALPQLNWS